MSQRRLHHQLDRIEALLIRLNHRFQIGERRTMALGEDILAKVTEQVTAVDSLIALVQELENRGLVSAGVSAQIFTALQDSKERVNAALLANTG